MSEFGVIAALHAALVAAGAGPDAGDVGIGDDAAVLEWPAGGPLRLLVCCDAVVAGVHADLALTGLDDLGWKALAATVSDVAAMGGRPTSAVVTVAAPPGCDLPLLYAGLGAAAAATGCPVVGGDLVGAGQLVVSVTVTGVVDGAAVLRSGASPGDRLWLTGPLGGAAAGLRLLRAALDAPAGPAPDAALAAAHARPVPRLAEGRAARAAGATAMIDVSDGLGADLGHLLDASGVGAELDDVPVRAGATLEEAVGGGDDYELLFAAPPDAGVAEAFAAAALPAPLPIGRVVAGRAAATLGGRPLPRAGWAHAVGP
ncbi:MAG TPA: thiamine-phosphate kinase [Acidimicrobiales bacterium]|nr:thiamine-phosphate kinase [Acidimicrobiales bacterium]